MSSPCVPFLGLSVQWRQQWRSWTVFHGICHKRMALNHAGVEIIKISTYNSVTLFPSSTNTFKFTDEMALVGGDSCECLPDCENTDYQYSMTPSKLRWGFFVVRSTFLFRSCDSRNLNLDPLCTLENGPIPKLWMNQVRAFPPKKHADCCTGERCLPKKEWSPAAWLYQGSVKPQ